MYARTITRYLHVTRSCWSLEKSQLATLRKKTGYTFSNCKKALELHNNDLIQAENWLHKQAQTLGWSKATKLEGRQTKQGLVGVAVNQNNGALVEVNCETDFVARNKTFQEMVVTATRACLEFAEQQPHMEINPITKINLNTEQMRQLPTNDGKSLADQLALMIGTLGENATLRRAVCFKTNTNILISSYAHPYGSISDNVLLGRFAGLLALQQKEPKDIDIDALGRQLCQHVVGMNPKKIGTSSDKPAPDPDDEPCLIHQEYIIDDNITVNDVLEENGVEIIDFKRFECGENLSIGIQPLSELKTCQ